jgi:hypothetical protein
LELGSAEFWRRLQGEPAVVAAQVCAIDAVNLMRTLQEHPSLRAWVEATHETARIAEERARWEETRLRAQVLLAAKATKDPATGKEKTGIVLTAEVDADDAVAAAAAAVHAAAQTRAVLRALSTALDDRAQMLTQLSANQRAERKEYS